MKTKTEDAMVAHGSGQVRPAGFEITPCVFAAVAEDCCFVLHLPVLSSSANPDLNWFWVGFVLFSFFPKYLKITTTLVTW